MTAAQFQEALGALLSGAIHSGVTFGRVAELLRQAAEEVEEAAATDEPPAPRPAGRARPTGETTPMAMSAETKRLILENWNAGVSADRIVKALAGRYSRSAVLGLIDRARRAGEPVRAGAPDPAARVPGALAPLALELPAAVAEGLAAIAAEGEWESVEACAASMLAAIVADDARAHAVAA